MQPLQLPPSLTLRLFFKKPRSVPMTCTFPLFISMANTRVPAPLSTRKRYCKQARRIRGDGMLQQHAKCNDAMLIAVVSAMPGHSRPDAPRA